jgi:predicted metal-dependent hydrolase
MGVDYESISIKFQSTRFGSCSSKKNLNFNALIALMPREILDYVIVHELSHLKEMNHSPDFWKEVQTVIPTYKESRKWLKENGLKYMQLI